MRVIFLYLLFSILLASCGTDAPNQPDPGAAYCDVSALQTEGKCHGFLFSEDGKNAKIILHDFVADQSLTVKYSEEEQDVDFTMHPFDRKMDYRVLGPNKFEFHKQSGTERKVYEKKPDFQPRASPFQ